MSLRHLALLVAASLPPLLFAGSGIGWRTDGTGSYPAATPPTAWSTEKNVVWKTKLPGRSHAQPVVLSDRIVVTAEPDVVACLDKQGKGILWQKSTGYTDVFGPEKAAKIAADLQKADELKKTQRPIRREVSRLKKLDDPPKDQIEKLQAQIKEIDEQVKKLSTIAPPRRGANGNTTATPISDGESVFAVFGSGIVVAFALDGKRKWAVYVESAAPGFGHSASPALVDDKLIVHFRDMVALDAGTGKELWRAKIPARHGSPVVGKIGATPVIVSPSGVIVKADDGSELNKRLFTLGHSSPVLDRGVVFAMAGGQNLAFKLPEKLGEAFEPTKLWAERGMRERRFASPLVHDGLMYGVTEKGIFEVVDASTGQNVYKMRLDMGQRGRVYPSPTQAGGYVFLSSDNGVTLVLKPGRKYAEVARNELEPFSAAPVFEGARMYIRAREHLYCIGK